MQNPSYTLMTAAYNEARFLPATIRAVLAQEHRPERWIIVSDASIDETDGIAKEAATAHDFICFLRFENRNRSPHLMGGTSWKKVSALRAGLQHFGPVCSAYLGNIDADVTFAPNFFSGLLKHMEAEPDIGLGGGFIYNSDGGVLTPFNANPDTVCGPLQLFKRSVYERIGGYVPWGQEDTIAQIMVRMKGWRVRAFADLQVLHHKTAKDKGHHRLRGQIHAGKMERALGFHPLHVVAKCGSRLHRRPLGSLARLCGYAWGAVRCLRSELPADVMAFNRQEQLKNLYARVLRV